jgi:hypothetical protein
MAWWKSLSSVRGAVEKPVERPAVDGGSEYPSSDRSNDFLVGDAVLGEGEALCDCPLGRVRDRCRGRGRLSVPALSKDGLESVGE